MVSTRSKSKQDTSASPESPKEDKLQKRRELLLSNDYKEVEPRMIKRTVKSLPLGTRVSYFGLDKDKVVKIRAGGWLLNNEDDRYFILRSTAPYSSRIKPKFISFSVQYNNVVNLFYKLRKNAKLEDRTKRKEKSDILSSARMPLFCPECNRVMKKRLDNKMWMLHNHCFDCQIEFENKLRVAGKYEEWEKEKMIDNAKAYIQEVKNELDDYVDALKTDNLLYETGPTSVETEKWEKVDTEKIKIQWLKEIQEVEDNLEQYISGN